LAGTYYPAYLRYAHVGDFFMHEQHDDWTCHLQRRRTEQPRVARRPNMHAKKRKEPATDLPICDARHARFPGEEDHTLPKATGHGVGSRLSVCVARRRARPRTARRRPCPVPVAGSVCPLPQWAERSREPGAGRLDGDPRDKNAAPVRVPLSHALVTRRRPLLCWSSGPPSFPISSFPFLPCLFFLARGRSAWTTSAPLPASHVIAATPAGPANLYHDLPHRRHGRTGREASEDTV
jgi:hypothetical protein